MPRGAAAGPTLPTDGFGKALHEAGIPTKAVMEWTKDPQVDFDGKKGSLFDLLEDLDAGECLAARGEGGMVF